MTTSGSSQAGFLPARVIQLHPSRFCNLACQHCYSESGPDQRAELDPSQIVSALALLRMEGYDVLSLSGGEPLLYSGFETVVRHAVELGFQVNLISNGAPVGGRLLTTIADYVSLIAISLDGAPATHNKMRGDDRAFAHAERALERLADTGVPYGLAYCVSRESLADMAWAVEFAIAKQATLVQFHPYAPTGRGRHLTHRLSLSEADKARAYVMAELLRLEDGPALQLDLAPVSVAQRRRDDYAVLTLNDGHKAALSDLVNPLIIDERGQLLPLCYGVDTRFAFAQAGPDLVAQITRYKEADWSQLRSLLAHAFDLLDVEQTRFIDWFYHIVEASRTTASVHSRVHINEQPLAKRLLREQR